MMSICSYIDTHRSNLEPYTEVVRRLPEGEHDVSTRGLPGLAAMVCAVARCPCRQCYASCPGGSHEAVCHRAPAPPATPAAPAVRSFPAPGWRGALALRRSWAQHLVGRWRYAVLGILLCAVCGGLVEPTVGAAQSLSLPTARQELITTDKGSLGDMLRAWAAVGSAAGNIGDWYDNRDREHSGLQLDLWPQLQKVAYSEEERQRGVDWGAQGRVLPFVVFGNSSTSSSLAQGGSNTRQLYTHPLGLRLLYAQYRHHNLYIYPEHADHDPGHNGDPGHGDLYPTNTPYLITSQGSSGSDQPFMHALPFTLAAFRPEVKRKLIDTGTLMSTVQMIFRLCNTHLGNPQEYLTGKAHPSVFDGAWVNVPQMVLMAQAMTLDTLPPVVHIEAIEEDAPRHGQDFFDAPSIPTEVLAERYPGVHRVEANLEQHADTPAVIARLLRGRNFWRRIVVSAAESFDLSQRPLTFHWVVLRGEAQHIRITPLDAAGTQAEIVVPYTGRRPIFLGSALESNRIDIGVFVHNGVYYSAPAFVTFLSLDNEARTYDAHGRVLEIGYGMGTTVLHIVDWLRLFTWLEPQTEGLVAQFVRTLFSADALQYLQQVGRAYRQARQAEDRAAAERHAAEAQHSKHVEALKSAATAKTAAEQASEALPTPENTARQSLAIQEFETAQQTARLAETTAHEAGKTHEAARRAAAEVLMQPGAGQSLTPSARVLQVLSALIRQPQVLERHAPSLQPLWEASSPETRAMLEAERRTLVAWGVAQEGRAGFLVHLTPLRAGTAPVEERLTPFELSLLTHFHATWLTQLVFVQVVSATFRPHYVDPRLTAAKRWRDVYHYDATGRGIGWTRFDGQQQVAFNAAGHRVEATDAAGRCIKARTMLYAREAANKNRDGGDVLPNVNPLRVTPGPEFVYYTYDGAEDTQGREIGREAVTVVPLPPEAPSGAVHGH